MPTGWRESPPVYRSDRLTLREVEHVDAPSLAQQIACDDVTRFISPPPRTVTGLQRWIARMQRWRTEGKAACFAIVPAGHKAAVGFIQLFRRAADDPTGVWEIGFVLGKDYWGTGLFREAAAAALTIAFDVLEATRIDAGCLVANGRGNAVLAKLGATCVGVALSARDPDGNVGDYNRWQFHPEAVDRSRR